MSITNLMNKTCTQTAVYWGNPTLNVYNTRSYDAPVEILCRWEGKQQVLKMFDAKGRIIEYVGIVYVLQDLDTDGCLFLGTLDDLDAGAYEQPEVMENVYPIKQFEKLPTLGSTTEFLRKAYLTLWQYR